MFSLSTSWNSSEHKNGFDIIDAIKAIGFNTVELNFALTEDVIRDILRMKEEFKIKISSLHNICPLPKEIKPAEASPDYYSLASCDEEERKRAVALTKNTIDYANRFEAMAVVLHAGRIPIKDHTRDLADLIDDKEQFKRLKAEMINERIAKRGSCLDSVIKSLNELIPYANEQGVSLGIENRYYYREIPIKEELEIIFKNFKIGSLYYWHDVGHAEVFDRLGLASHRDLLDTFSSRLIGIHLHDIIGLVNDHKAPGLGTFDFNIVKPYISDDTIKVVEVHQPATAEQIRQGIKYLTKILG